MNYFRAILLILVFSALLAQSAMAGEASYFFSDLGSYLSVPARWDSNDWLQFGAISSGLLFVSNRLDDRWRREMVSESHPSYYGDIARVGNQWGDLHTSGIFMLGVYGYGHMSNNTTYLNAGYNMMQSAAYAQLTTTVLKDLFGRVRPDEAKDASDWFKNGHAFPSGHTTLAFAVSRSYLNSMESPSIATQALFYGLATSTAFARPYSNRHWASDVIAGALIGIYTADFVRDQHKKRQDDVSVAPYIGSGGIGIKISWR